MIYLWMLVIFKNKLLVSQRVTQSERTGHATTETWCVRKHGIPFLSIDMTRKSLAIIIHKWWYTWSYLISAQTLVDCQTLASMLQVRKQEQHRLYIYYGLSSFSSTSHVDIFTLRFYDNNPLSNWFQSTIQLLKKHVISSNIITFPYYETPRNNVFFPGIYSTHIWSYLGLKK